MNDISNLDDNDSKGTEHMMIATKRLLSQITSSKTALTSLAILGTTLCLSAFPLTVDVFAQSTTAASSPPVTVKTDNNSVTVIVNWTPKEIQAGQNVDFSLEFQNPSSGQALSHVNYNLKIVDANSGKAIKSVDGIHTHSGKDVQTVKFDNVGNFRLEVTVIGLGLNQPFDTSRNGSAHTAIMVVPEFPFAPVAMAAGVAVMMILLARSRYSSLPKLLTGKQQQQ